MRSDPSQANKRAYEDVKKKVFPILRKAKEQTQLKIQKKEVENIKAVGFIKATEESYKFTEQDYLLRDLKAIDHFLYY